MAGRFGKYGDLKRKDKIRESHIDRGVPAKIRRIKEDSSNPSRKRRPTQKG